MSGILGLMRRDGAPADRAQLARMSAMLAHRGPDAAHIWQDGPVGLGQRMLWTTPESQSEVLPQVTPDGTLAITADARLDNRDELLPLLAGATSAADLSDSDLILRAYQRWGVDCPQHLVGDYAFAIYDQTARRLFAARDHIGARPFYYHLGPQVFVFASEIKALFCLPEVPRALNELAIGLHLAAVEDDGRLTLYAGIQRLPAAHALLIDDTGSRTWRYWSLDPDKTLRLPHDEDYIEAFREGFLQAVRSRLRSAYPVGTLLSGGLDSAAITSAARHLLDSAGDDQPLHTFSAIFPDLPDNLRRYVDERDYIAAVTARPGIHAQAIAADQLHPLADLQGSLWHQDGLYYGPTMYIEEALCQQARHTGVRVLLDGIDGDTVVSHGWEYLPRLAATGRWPELVRLVNAYKRNSGDPFSRKQVILQGGFGPLLGDVARWLRRPAPPTDMELLAGRIIRPDFARRTGLTDYLRASLAAHTYPSWNVKAERLQVMDTPLNAYGLEIINRQAAAHQLEKRHPFYDRRLMELSLAVPPRLKLHNGWPRGILRYALDGILPPAVQWRTTKGNLSVNFRYQLMQQPPPLLDAMLAQPGQMADYVDMAALRQHIDAFRADPLGPEQPLLMLYQAALLYLALHHLDYDFTNRPDDETCTQL